jgi:ABC-type sugar transport system ATPase subunit
VAETISVACERHLASKDIVAAAFQLPASFESELAVAAKVDELIELMDRVLIFREGSVFTELDRDELSRERLVAGFFGRGERAADA